jgi:hypothetical protein
MCNKVENQKKKTKFPTLPRVALGKGCLPSFAERNDRCTRQRIGFAESLARLALGKEFFLKK